MIFYFRYKSTRHQTRSAVFVKKLLPKVSKAEAGDRANPPSIHTKQSKAKQTSMRTMSIVVWSVQESVLKHRLPKLSIVVDIILSPLPP